MGRSKHRGGQAVLYIQKVEYKGEREKYEERDSRGG